MWDYKKVGNISNDNYVNGVNNNANMHQLVKLSTIQKNKQSKKSSHKRNIGIELKLNYSLKNAYYSKADHK